MKIREYMTPAKEMACATPATTLKEVAQKMKQADAGMIPVCSESNPDELVGLITDRDIAVRAVAEGVDPSAAKTEQFMSTNVITVSPDTSTKEAASLMSKKQLHRLPVVEDGKLVGIVSLGDLAEVEADQAEKALEGISHGAKAENRVQ